MNKQTKVNADLLEACKAALDILENFPEGMISADCYPFGGPFRAPIGQILKHAIKQASE